MRVLYLPGYAALEARSVEGLGGYSAGFIHRDGCAPTLFGRAL